MQISMSELIINIGKYVDMAETEDVIITKNGKPAAKITGVREEPWAEKQIPERITSVEQLFGTLPSDIVLDDIKAERLKK